MKNCPNCNASMPDDAVFCSNCGKSADNANQFNNYAQPQNNAYSQPVAPVVNQYDHTSEFSPEDVHNNKLFALLVYLMGIVGVVIALLAKKSSDSPYLSFHIKQALKILITEAIVTVLTMFLFWTCIVAIAGGVAAITIVVLNIICFIQTCRNKSIEVPIIRSIGFLN